MISVTDRPAHKGYPGIVYIGRRADAKFIGFCVASKHIKQIPVGFGKFYGALFSMAILLLSSCVEVSTDHMKYKSPPWGNMAYKRSPDGTEMLTTAHDAGWAATMTGIQNIAGTIGAGYAVGQATHVNANNNAADVSKHVSDNATAVQLGAQKVNPTVIDATQKAVFPPIK